MKKNMGGVDITIKVHKEHHKKKKDNVYDPTAPPEELKGWI